MRSELETEDIQAIAASVAEFMKPHLALLKTAVVNDRIMGVQELAEYLGMSDKWVYDQTGSQRIPYFKLGSILKFRQKEIDKWLRQFEAPAVDKPTAMIKLVKR